VDINSLTDMQARIPDLRDNERRRDDQGQFPLRCIGVAAEHRKELLRRLAPVETAYHGRTEAPAHVHPLIGVASLAPNYDGQAAEQSQPTALATHAGISYHEEDDVPRAMRAVQTAYDALQALRASHHSNIPSSLSDAEKAMDKLSGKLSVLNDSPEALSIFCEYTVKEASNSVGTSLSDAIVHDMEAMATYFRAMKPVGPTDDWDEQKYRSIKAIIDRYKMIVSTVLSKYKECVQNISTQYMYPVDLL
jgi:hypothetical protein